MLNYLRAYAAHFDLLPHIRFRHEVLNVQRGEKFEHNGKWTVSWRQKKKKPDEGIGKEKKNDKNTDENEEQEEADECGNKEKEEADEVHEETFGEL
jgi:hypothetical protein